MNHNITTARTSAELVEAYNASHQSWTVPAPTGAKLGDDVMFRSRDGVDFMSYVSGIHDNGDMTIRVRG